MLLKRFYILSRLGGISRGLAFYSISYHVLAVSTEAISSLGSICQYLEFYSISDHALAVSAKQYQLRLYLITRYLKLQNIVDGDSFSTQANYLKKYCQQKTYNFYV